MAASAIRARAAWIAPREMGPTSAAQRRGDPVRRAGNAQVADLAAHPPRVAQHAVGRHRAKAVLEDALRYGVVERHDRARFRQLPAHQFGPYAEHLGALRDVGVPAYPVHEVGDQILHRSLP